MNLNRHITGAIILSSTIMAPVAFANANGQGFEPTTSTCLLVGQELERVNDELRTTKSGIQKSWLKRHLAALRDKKTSCTTEGFKTQKI